MKPLKLAELETAKLAEMVKADGLTATAKKLNQLGYRNNKGNKISPVNIHHRMNIKKPATSPALASGHNQKPAKSVWTEANEIINSNLSDHLKTKFMKQLMRSQVHA